MALMGVVMICALALCNMIISGYVNILSVA